MAGIRFRVPKIELAAMARSAGYAQVHDFSDLANFEQQAGHMLAQEGPVFATLHVERSKPLSYDYPRLYDPARRAALEAALALPRPLAAASGGGSAHPACGPAGNISASKSQT